MTLFETAINGLAPNKKFHEDYEPIAARTYELIDSLINIVVNGDEEKKSDDHPIYIKDTFKAMVDKKEHIKISLFNVKHKYPLLEKYFISPLSGLENNLPSFAYLSSKLFKNCKSITVEMLGECAFLDNEFLERLALMLRNEINDKTKLQAITLIKCETHQVQDELTLFKSRIQASGWHYREEESLDVAMCQNLYITKRLYKDAPIKQQASKPKVAQQQEEKKDNSAPRNSSPRRAKLERKIVASIHRNNKNILGYFVTEHSAKLLKMEQEQKNRDAASIKLKKIVSNDVMTDDEKKEDVEADIDTLELLKKKVASMDSTLKHHRVRSDIMNAIELNKIVEKKDTQKLKQEILSSLVELTDTLRQIQQMHANVAENVNIVGFLQSIDNNMDDLILASQHVRITAKSDSDYDLLKFFIESYYKLVQPIVIDQLLSQHVPISQRLFSISWISKFESKINTLEQNMSKYANTTINNRNFIDNLHDQQNVLMKCYIDFTVSTIEKRIDKIVEKEIEKQEHFMVNKCPNVHCTQLLWSTIEHQFRIAMQNLNGKAFVQIIQITLKSMDRFKTKWKKYIEENWREEFEDEYLCAILNSCNIVANKLEKTFEQISKSMDEYEINVEQENILKQSFDNKVTIFKNISNESAIKLSQRIFDDTLKENIFDELFTDQHFDDDDDLSLSMIETLRDYFGDLKVWIQQPTLFWQVVTSTIVVITNGYLKELMDKKPDKPIEVLWKKIDDDIDALNNYFGQEEDLEFCRILWNIKYKYLTSIRSGLRCEQQDFQVYANILRNDRSYGNDLVAYIDAMRNKHNDPNV